MNRLFLLLPFLIFSCSQIKQISKSEESKLILELLEKYIVHDSLYETRTINKYLLPYEYYEQEYSEDGDLAPPPYGYGSKNEFDIINSIELNPFFSDSASIVHVKHQLLNSEKIAKKHKLSTLDIVNLAMNNEDQDSWYSFYLPIFNADSSAVYMQYDFYPNGFGGFGWGNGAVLLKENGEWKYHDFIPGWIN
ncbi:hypothetical protein [Algoriphagus aquimarinus]|uniref:hypothetical protein n=1 Tax=Algoriphagus aquimarinus TaxID=237018 RepID=UPI0030DB36BD|tara:strand:+ start:7736 stop:8314 length:579 start_codon:yes stop_codon:yes gene_type:complete